MHLSLSDDGLNRQPEKERKEERKFFLYERKVFVLIGRPCLVSADDAGFTVKRENSEKCEVFFRRSDNSEWGAKVAKIDSLRTNLFFFILEIRFARLQKDSSCRSSRRSVCRALCLRPSSRTTQVRQSVIWENLQLHSQRYSLFGKKVGILKGKRQLKNGGKRFLGWIDDHQRNGNKWRRNRNKAKFFEQDFSVPI